MKGYKVCKCGEDIPARSKICLLCNYEFKEGDKFEKKPTIEESAETQEFLVFAKRYLKSRRETFVHTPAGNCPAHYPGDIEEWIDNIMFAGKTNNIFYSPLAIRYFIIQQFGNKTEMYDECMEVLHHLTHE